MKEVSLEKFNEIVEQIPYKISFILGESATRYVGKGKRFKDHLFAKQDKGKFYVLDTLV